MSDSRLLMTPQETAEKVRISQQVVNSVTAKLWIKSLNLHLNPPKGLAHNVVAGPQKLKKLSDYVMHSLGDQPRLQITQGPRLSTRDSDVILNGFP